MARDLSQGLVMLRSCHGHGGSLRRPNVAEGLSLIGRNGFLATLTMFGLCLKRGHAMLVGRT